MTTTSIIENLKEKTDEQLQEEYQSLFDTIHVVRCFETKDVMLFDFVGCELERRGYHIQENTTVAFVKDDDNEIEKDNQT